ncbi:putative tyrosine-protein phosphatase [Calycina marina]|uniref:Tyrosine-protein phosphatase n=1 Tax=Calycina marina TaxID=1763456 RepID=A0A9P7YZR4_9HELO|nr:putative tyrosine-protein phosphatase [Calycina marina]
MPPEMLQTYVSSVPELANLRDIGGYPVGKQNSIRKGVVYRGPALLSPESIGAVHSLGVTVIFDLRSQQQIDRQGGHHGLDGIRRVWSPIFGPEEYTPERAALRYAQYSAPGTKDIVDAFSDILESGTESFRCIMLHIASLIQPSSDLPIPAFLVHCTTGNNRTGVFIGILQALLGADHQLVAEEYALSQTGLAASRPAAIARLTKIAPIFAGEGGRKRCERMVGARAESMIAMLEMVRGRWGSVEGYARNLCKLSKEDIDKVRQVLIAEA